MWCSQNPHAEPLDYVLVSYSSSFQAQRHVANLLKWKILCGEVGLFLTCGQEHQQQHLETFLLETLLLGQVAHLDVLSDQKTRVWREMHNRSIFIRHSTLITPVSRTFISQITQPKSRRPARPSSMITMKIYIIDDTTKGYKVTETSFNGGNSAKAYLI